MARIFCILDKVTMNEKDIFNYGEEILHSINKAVESRNFSNLSKEIKSSVSGATATIRANMESGLKNVLSRNDQRTPFFSVKVNKYIPRITGIIKIISGSFIDFITLILLLGTDIKENPVFFIFELFLLALGTGLIVSGRHNFALIKSYFGFGTVIGNKTYITLKELSDKMSRPTKKIISQIKQMKKRGWLPYAALDTAETTLILTDDVYTEYVKSMEYHAKQQKKAASKKSAGPSADEKNPNVTYYTIDENLPKDVQNILKEGLEYLNKIRHFNDLIPDTETMSDKLYTLEATALSIFKKLKETPDIAGDLRKFMSYYLPTTEKLLQSYVDLRKESQSIENITNSQKEIEEATDIMNDAFVKLLNQLFESTSWDIASDISVMKTMMKQDALL